MTTGTDVSCDASLGCSKKSKSRWQVAIHDLQQHQMLSRRRCGIMYMARSACWWLTITDAVKSCCQQHSASLLQGTRARCDCNREDEYGQSEFNTLWGTQPMQVLEEWSNTVVLPPSMYQPCCCIEHRLTFGASHLA